MSIDDQLPAVADASSTAIAARIAGAIQADAAAFAGKLATSAPASAPAEQIAGQLEAVARAAAPVWDELLTAAAVTPAQLEYAQPVIADYVLAAREARRAGDRAELSRLGHNLGLDLVIAGALTVPQLERMRPVLDRFHPQAESLLRSLWQGSSRRSSATPADIDEMRALNLLIADPGSRYWKGQDAERLQARWRELYGQGVRGDAIPPTAPERIDARMVEIEKLMKTASSEYHRGPNAAALQQEYRDLIDQRERPKRRS